MALLGDFMLDTYVYGDCDRVSPEAPVPILRVVRRESRLGGAAAAAANVVALGGEVSCLGVVGDDQAGEELVGRLFTGGAHAEGITRLPGRPTTTRQRLIGLAQQRHQQQILRVDEEDDTPLPEETLARIATTLSTAGAMHCCQVLAIEDYAQGAVPDTGMREIISRARSAGLPVLVDPAPIRDYGRYRGATLLAANRQEATIATDVSITDGASIELAAEKILQATEAQGVVITLGNEGAYLKRAGKPGKHFPTQQRRVYDVTGAGEVMLTTLALAIAAGASWETAVTLANVAGGLEVERFGAVPILREELLAELVRLKRQQHGKVVSRQELLAELERLRSGGKSVVWTNGCFDIIHAGHVQYLNDARRQGDVLVVGINGDESVRRNKGPDRPIVGQEDRAEVLAGLECVDYVVVFEEETPLELIKSVRPDVLVKGAQWHGAVVGQEFVESCGGRVVLAAMRPERSTTGIIDKIAKVYGQRNQ